MGKERLTAFTDGVVAIIITIMVLELKVPHGGTFADLAPALPTFLMYVLSFVFVAIYWNNHHHMLHVVERVNGAVLWANMHLLFWLSLIPFATNWMGENHFSGASVAVYGGALFMCAIAYTILMLLLVRCEGPESRLARAMGHDWKGRVSLVIYAGAVALAFWWPPASLGLYVLVAVIWFIPDPRVERLLDA